MKSFGILCNVFPPYFVTIKNMEIHILICKCVVLCCVQSGITFYITHSATKESRGLSVRLSVCLSVLTATIYYAAGSEHWILVCTAMQCNAYKGRGSMHACTTGPARRADNGINGRIMHIN